MQKTVAILTFFLFFVITVMLPDVASAQSKKNTIVNQTTENVSVVYSTWRSATNDIPEGYLTRGHISLKPDKSVELTGWKNDVYFQILQDGEAIKPTAATETFRFWVYLKGGFSVVSPRMDGPVLRDELTYTKPTGITFTHEDGFLRYPNGSVVTVDSSWVSVSEAGEMDPEPPVSTASDLRITEIMVDTGVGLPQWIELTNVSGKEVNLDGWTLMIMNSDVFPSVSINLSGRLGVGVGVNRGGTMGKSLLLVGGTARSNLAPSARIVDISSQVAQQIGGRSIFISPEGFIALLISPTDGMGDTAGNLEDGWELPMSESSLRRSSLIRREMFNGRATKGTDADGWVLASDTGLYLSGPETWYGSPRDDGTPGYDAGGPLPVELSHFRPVRDKATGAVMITWATQSELNNAGFFIKRSQQRESEFKIINATMIPGAGTTSEKQFYTYTDTTAHPILLYYYQIEDVSLDGQRQMLTRAIRLKGHIGAADKLTSTWGELKTSNE